MWCVLRRLNLGCSWSTCSTCSHNIDVNCLCLPVIIVPTMIMRHMTIYLMCHQMYHNIVGPRIRHAILHVVCVCGLWLWLLIWRNINSVDLYSAVQIQKDSTCLLSKVSSYYLLALQSSRPSDYIPSNIEPGRPPVSTEPCAGNILDLSSANNW